MSKKKGEFFSIKSRMALYVSFIVISSVLSLLLVTCVLTFVQMQKENEQRLKYAVNSSLRGFLGFYRSDSGAIKSFLEDQRLLQMYYTATVIDYSNERISRETSLFANGLGAEVLAFYYKTNESAHAFSLRNYFDEKKNGTFVISDQGAMFYPQGEEPLSLNEAQEKDYRTKTVVPEFFDDSLLTPAIVEIDGVAYLRKSFRYTSFFIDEDFSLKKGQLIGYFVYFRKLHDSFQKSVKELGTRIIFFDRNLNPVGEKVKFKPIFLGDDQWGKRITTSLIQGQSFNSIFVPIEEDGQIFGHISAHISQDQVTEVIFRIILLFVGIGILIIFVYVLLSYLLMNRLLAPISSIVRASQRMIQGDLGHRIEYERNDELGILSEHFNEMQKSIRDKMDEMDALNKSLEKRVAERTVELQQEMEHKQEALQQVRESEYLLRETQRVAHIGGWKIDLETGRTIWSDSIYEMHRLFLGVPVDMLEGIPLYSTETNSKIQNYLRSIANTQVEHEFIDIAFSLPNAKKPTWLRLQGEVKEVNQQGKASCLYGTMQEITHLVELEEDAREKEMLAMQAAKLASLGEMAGGIAHEINNPLTIIASSAALLKRNFTKNNLTFEQRSLFVERISDMVKRISKIVRSMQVISRDSSEADLELCPLNLVFEDVSDLCHERLISMGIEYRIPKDNPLFVQEIPCLRIPLSQVFLNLISNAKDIVESEEEKWIEVLLEKNEEFILISFLNSGPKIDSNLIDKIFEPFYTTKDVGSGTGLGLSISKSIVKKHHGDLYVDVSHEYTCFVIKLPLSLED